MGGSSNSFLELIGGVSAVSGSFAVMASWLEVGAVALLISKSMPSSLVERTGEIGVLKTVGWTGRDVNRQLLAKAMAQCLLGGLLGVPLGFIGPGSSAACPSPWRYPGNSTRFRLRPRQRPWPRRPCSFPCRCPSGWLSPRSG